MTLIIAPENAVGDLNTIFFLQIEYEHNKKIYLGFFVLKFKKVLCIFNIYNYFLISGWLAS